MISVIIPTRHRNNALAQCLDCLSSERQTLKDVPYEVIVSDDGAATTAEALIRDSYPWVRWTQGPKRGPAANRNHAVTCAQGEWIAFTDDDCLPSAAWLGAFSTAIKEGVDVYEGKTTCQAGIDSPLKAAPVNLNGGSLWSCNLMVRKATFDLVGKFNEQFSFSQEDVEFRTRLIRLNIPINFVPSAIVDHPPRENRIGMRGIESWRGRVLLEALHGCYRNNSMPIHVLKVRILQLRAFPISFDWIPYLFGTFTEVLLVAFQYGRWKRESVSIVGDRAFDASRPYVIERQAVRP